MLERGILVVRRKGKNSLPSIQVKIGNQSFNIARGEVSKSILDRLEEFGGKDVEFERVGGQPKKIRQVGGEFVAPGTSVGSGPSSTPRTVEGELVQPSSLHKFHNPYNFVPAPPRRIQDKDLGDAMPVTHDRFHGGRYTGWIRVHMKAITPLIVPDPEKQQITNNGHLVVPVRVDSDGRPLIAASSVRGMLRSAYEAITNSRFGRFSDAYKSRLAYRMEARQGLGMIPARISNGKIHLLTGTSKLGKGGKPDGPMYAAWLPRYCHRAVKYRDGSEPQHGDRVIAWVERFQHHAWKSKENGHKLDFTIWRVRTLVKEGEGPGEKPQLSKREGKKKGHSWYEPLGEIRKIEGWVCITNRSINRKHDERVFFIGNGGEQLDPFPLTAALKQQWKELIENYQSQHEEELALRRKAGHSPDDYLGAEPGQTAWSRHVYEKGYEELREGTLCYARLSADKKNVEALFPVMISRELYQCSPWDLLDLSLRPAERIEQLSPADRVWGWVRTDPPTEDETARTAARGLARVGPVQCVSEDAIEAFPKPLPLTILSTPKPQQGRFYVAKNKQGDAQDDGLSKIFAGYNNKEMKTLRGRKVYPHHANLPPSHWVDPLEDRTQHGPPYREYRRPRDAEGNEQQDNQNRSVLGWIKPGAEFTFDLYIENLSAVELGALLWLLQLPDGHYLRFGGGRPLGFGSVRVQITDHDLRTPEKLKAWYSTWLEPKPRLLDGSALNAAVEAFKKAVTRAYPIRSGRFDDVAFIKAFLLACKGFGDRLPVHYPRVTLVPQPNGESFKWFVENERQGKYALPDLAKDTGLPILSERDHG